MKPQEMDVSSTEKKGHYVYKGKLYAALRKKICILVQYSEIII